MAANTPQSCRRVLPCILPPDSCILLRMIAIIDYGMGNLRSVQKAFERSGHAATITSDPAVLADADEARAARRRRVPRRHRRAANRASSSSRSARPSPRASRSSASAWACNCCSTSATRTASTQGLGVFPGEVVRFRRAARVQGAAHGLEPAAVPPPPADLRRHRRRRVLLLRPLVLRRAARRVDRRHRDRLPAARSARASGATTCSPRSSTRRRARTRACGC